MNKEIFQQQIEKNRTCNPALLDAAVSRGINKAITDKLDFTKLIVLGVACLIVALLCLSMNTMPVKTITDNYFQNRYEIVSESGKAFEEYVNNFTINTNKNLGDE